MAGEITAPSSPIVIRPIEIIIWCEMYVLIQIMIPSMMLLITVLSYIIRIKKI